jgi:hypothetical protein
MTTRHPAIILALVAAFALTLSSCARRANLDTPSEARAEAQAASEEREVTQEDLPPKPERRFFLDGLI